MMSTSRRANEEMGRVPIGVPIPTRTTREPGRASWVKERTWLGNHWAEDEGSATHEDGHLDATLDTRALENDIESIVGRDSQIGHGGIGEVFSPLGSLFLVLWRRGALGRYGDLPGVGHAQGVLGEIELGGVDVDGGDAGRSQGDR